MPTINFACHDASDLLAGDPTEPDHDLDVDAFEEETEDDA